MQIQARKIRVRGLVQGVGFRPNVWRLARQFSLTGSVINDGEGVLIFVWGNDTNITAFKKSLIEETLPLSRIDAIDCSVHAADNRPDEFTIASSDVGVVTTSIIPDAATCDQCLDDITDPQNRRFRYPFTNCTHCGPRLSITRSIPYDRQNTSMARFVMCDKCWKEYEDPADRRFHAQPNACPDCGPAVWLCDREGETIKPPVTGDVISLAADLVLRGEILAIKGIGGFHLCCDASNDEAVNRLRKCKKRYGKPLALMADSVDMVKHYAEVSDHAREALQSTPAPIVLLPKLATGRQVSNQIAPDQSTLGFMLSYTPLHHLLVANANRPLVMTSGNISNEPQVIDNDEAMAKLSAIADYWLMHDREIVNRLDDSVVQEIAGQVTSLRRARGYAPDTLILPGGFEKAPPILAMGGELKNTFCLLAQGKVIVSQHIGDLHDADIHVDYRKSLSLYQAANQFSPERIATDMHPGYFSTLWGEKVAAENGCLMDKIQHHHAHIAACLAEHEYPLHGKAVLGIALDGLGYGDDDGLWGGEFLIADYRGYQRVLSFEPVAIPGGEKASYEPWRNSFAHLHAAIGWSKVEQQYGSLELIRFLNEKPLAQIKTMIERDFNSPGISSAGRLFDAVAAVLGLFTDAVHFEGQAAMALQALAETSPHEKAAYETAIAQTISWRPMWEEILTDLAKDVSKSKIAARFHNTLINVIGEATPGIARESNIETVVITGGVFQNRLLCQGVFEALTKQRLKVLFPQKYPANDGGISLGQAAISAARSLI